MKKFIRWLLPTTKLITNNTHSTDLALLVEEGKKTKRNRHAKTYHSARSY